MKKDIKYIIKKIIIGVGITFGVMLIKSLPVFAEEKEQIASCQFGRNPTSQFVSYKNDCTKYIQNVGLKKDPDNYLLISILDSPSPFTYRKWEYYIIFTLILSSKYEKK